MVCCFLLVLVAAELRGFEDALERVAGVVVAEFVGRDSEFLTAGVDLGFGEEADVADAKNVDDIMESAIGLFKDQIAKLVAKGDITTPPAAPKSDDLDL